MCLARKWNEREVFIVESRVVIFSVLNLIRGEKG